MSTSVIESLRSSLGGALVAEGDSGYDEARVVYNAMIDRRPAAIVRCQGTDDVVAVVRAAAESRTDLAIRGGGHSVPGFGTADGALVADLGDLTSVAVDPASSTAEVGGGATWGMFNEAAGAHGLATTGGIISTTGVGGLTLGGGIGYLARGFGLSCDNLLSAEVVLADGRVVTASPDEDPDLFWALRGGGGNFGVVTKFRFQLHPVAEIYGGPTSSSSPTLRPSWSTSTVRSNCPTRVRRVPRVPDRAATAFRARGSGRRAVLGRHLLLQRPRGRRGEDRPGLPRRREARGRGGGADALSRVERPLRRARAPRSSALLEGRVPR